MNPAAWLRLLEYLLIEAFPVLYAPKEAAEIDKIELVVVVCPHICNIVDDEFRVGWNPGRLNRAKVNADDVCFWMSVGEVDGPDASPATQVYRIVTLVADWS